MFCLYTLIYEVMSLKRASSSMSSLTLYSHFLLGCPLLLLPSIKFDSTILIVIDGNLLRTCLYHLNLHSFGFLVIRDNPNEFLITTFKIISSKFQPQVHLNIIISVTSNFLPCSFLDKQHSNPYIMVGLTTTILNFPFSFNGTFVSYETPKDALQWTNLILYDGWNLSLHTLP